MNNMEPRYCNKPDLVKLHLKEVHDLDLDLTEHNYHHPTTINQPPSEQYLELPRALCDAEGMPNKGSKSTGEDYLENRCQSIHSSTLPTGWEHTVCHIWLANTCMA